MIDAFEEIYIKITSKWLPNLQLTVAISVFLVAVYSKTKRQETIKC